MCCQPRAPTHSALETVVPVVEASPLLAQMNAAAGVDSHHIVVVVEASQHGEDLS